MKSHGKFQAELKVRYPVFNRKNRYGLDVYIFSPKVLTVDSKSYGIAAFLKDLRTMTRISTPEIVLPQLVDQNCSESPLSRIKIELEKASGGGRIKNQRLIYELRTLASILRVQMRKSRVFLSSKLESGEDVELLGPWLVDFLKQTDDFLECFRGLKKLFVNPQIDDQLNLAFDWTDESISLNIQREIGVMQRICSHSHVMSGCGKLLINVIDREIKHRTQKGYLTGIGAPDSSNTGELLVFRENILKKWSQSAMYLNVSKSRTPARVGQIIAGVAAAAAMTFAVLATILTNHFFPANTKAWAFAAVVAYIFKDRIKETLRAGIKTLMPHLIPDRMIILRDSSVQKRSGSTKSFVKFSSAGNVPEEIQKARGWDRKPFRELLPSENVIRYRHDVVLDGRKFFRNHERMESVTEILRLELHKFLQLMDDPDQIYYYAEDGQLKKKRLRRVYHLNVVTVLTDRTEAEESILHHRIILNRDGIVRIEREDL
ncbi:MAG: hypothetical protein JEZ04_08925 [Spirochaetales bacterium]|nr:hypothetical protein [Spirochaetales bacterium]